MAPRRPYSRGEFNRALVLNALLSPFNVLLLAGMVIAGIVLGITGPVAVVALLVYGVACARTYFDEDVAGRVLQRERAERRGVERPPLDVRSLAPPIARLVEDARLRRHRIAALGFDEISVEVGSFVAAIEGTAPRAQLLYSTLAETPAENVERRLQQIQASADPAYRELQEALTTQLATLRRMETQLTRFFAEMERMLVELDTIRSSLVSASVAEHADRQHELAGEVRALREQVGAVADGMAEAYGPPSAP